MSFGAKHIAIHLHLARLLYLFMIVLSFYWLFMSRSGDMYTVWGFMNPALMPTFFVATFILLVIVFSSETAEYKLLFIILHSVLCLSFSLIILPAGVVGTPQIVLGRTRLVFDNVVLHGPWGWESASVLRQLYLWLRGTVLQTAFSVILARMFGVDVYWSHQLFLPLLWGIFVPTIAFKISQAVGADKKVSILSGLFASLSTGAIISGATPVPNSLGFLFFFCSLYFAVKYLLYGGARFLFLLMLFSLVSFLSHFLTGAVSMSFFLLAAAFRVFTHLESKSSAKAKSFLLFSFLFCISVLPLALRFQGVFYATTSASFSLDKLSGLSLEDAIWLLFLGKNVDFDAKALLIRGVSPLVGLVGMVYSLSSRKSKKRHGKDHFTSILFLFMGFLIVLIDYRILKLFMVSIPFSEERVWVFRDLVAIPFIAIVVNSIFVFLGKMMSGRAFTGARFSLSSLFPRDKRVFITCMMILIPLSGWITASVYYAYPHSGPLQTTPYEIEAVKYIEETTNRSYVVVCDQWITYAGQMFVGVYNPRAFYFAHTDYRLIGLFNSALNDPSPEPLIEAMTYNDSTIAYFIVEKPRLGEKEFERVVAQASFFLRVYAIFGEGQLYIFYYEKT